MKQELLEAIGLTPSQARAYRELIKAGSLTPPQLAKVTGESRTATYMSLAKLAELGLAKEIEDAKKQTYLPVSPSVLNRYLAQKREQLAQLEGDYKEALPGMLSYYYSYRGKPGIRFYEGEDGLEQIYADHLRTREKVYVIRTEADEKYFGTVLYNYMNKRASLGIETELLGPGYAGAIEWAKENDDRLKRVTTWFPPQAYTAPVEISVYGTKVSMISFGDEAVGTIIESPQIAQAMCEVFAMAKRGAAEMTKAQR
jgi:sugar-specific transcriptional regulator TrmB